MILSQVTETTSLLCSKPTHGSYLIWVKAEVFSTIHKLLCYCPLLVPSLTLCPASLLLPSFSHNRLLTVMNLPGWFLFSALTLASPCWPGMPLPPVSIRFTPLVHLFSKDSLTILSTIFFLYFTFSVSNTSYSFSMLYFVSVALILSIGFLTS